MAQLPPLWFWAMNPRALAANDFCNGKDTSDVTFNNIQKLTAQDKKVKRVVYLYFGAITLAFGYLAFMTDTVCVLKSNITY